MPKGNTKAIAIFIISLMIILGGLVFLKNRNKTVEQDPFKPEIEAPAKPGRKFPTMKLSEEEKEEIDNKSINTALQTGTIEGCAEIKYDEELRKQCEDSINFSLIIKNGNEKMCEKLHNENMKQECYDKIFYSAARDTKDEKLCNKIKDEKLKTTCLDFVKLSNSRNAKSENDCNGISDEGLRNECKNNFRFKTVVRSLDEESCDNITSEAMKERCKKTIKQNKIVIEKSKKEVVVKRKKTEDVLKDCDSLGEERAIKCKDESNFKLALEKKDPAYCNEIKDGEKRIECIRKQQTNQDGYNLRLALAKKDATLCNKLINTQLKSDCLTAIQ